MMTEDPRYRFNPLYRNHFKAGQFVSNRHARLPRPEMGIHIGLYNDDYAGFDWLAEYNTTSFTYDDATVDRMIAELEYKGYC